MPKGRRARRVIRKIDTWSVLRLSLLFYFALLLTCLVAGVILWQVAATVGITDNVIKLIKKLGDFSSYQINGGVILRDVALAGVILWQVAATVGITDNIIKLIKKLGDFSSYQINGGVILRDVAFAGVILAIFGACLNALMCVLYNLISDVVGGIRFEMFDEELPARRGRTAGQKTATATASVSGAGPEEFGVAASTARSPGADGNGSVDGNGSPDSHGSPDGNGAGKTPAGRPARGQRAQAQTS